jgi:serine phosphatase RsbU (regulator of sigma subunit)
LVNRATGLKDDMVGSLYPDREGGLWLGLDNGLARVETPSPLSLYAEPFGIRGSVEDIMRHQERLYAATAQGVYFVSYPTPTPTGKLPVFQPVSGIATQSWSLLTGNNMLLAATNDGVFTIEENRATQRVSDLSAFVLYRSRQDSNRVYVGLEEGLGLLLWTNGSWRLAGQLSGMIGRVRSIAEDEEGTLWLGTESQSVLRVKVPSRPWGGAIDPSTPAVDIAHFTGEHGIPPGSVYAIFVNQQVRFSTSGGLRYFDRRSQSFLPDSTFGATFADTTRTIGHIIEDSHGRVIIRGSDQNGVVIAMAVPQEDGTYAVNAAPFRQVSEYGHIWASYADPDDPGVVWFGSEESILRYDPAVAKDYAVEYAALVRRVTVDLKGTGADSEIFGGTLDYGAEVSPPPRTLRYANNALRFEYAAPSYGGASKILYQVFLEGFDKSWSEWSDDTRKNYTNLPAGDYRFRVRAKNGYEHLSREALYRFTILPPWWRTWWAYTLYGLFIVASVFAVDRVQRRRLVRKEREKAFLREKELRAESAEHLSNYLQSENLRQTQELEQARQLQLSMLPQKLPEHPVVEIAAYMQTATEVGGDYYDFDLADDGTLTIAIGDATGHGAEAGIMVTAMKTLWNAFSRDTDLEGVLHKSNQALKRMHLPKLYMALALARLQGQRLELVGAGMPPALLYRAASGWIEAVPLKGMPLGGPGALPYRGTSVALSPGDTLILMSDGFPELFNESREMLGYAQASEVFREVAERLPQEIIAHLMQTAKAWCNGQVQADDMTFVVMKVKA